MCASLELRSRLAGSNAALPHPGIAEVFVTNRFGQCHEVKNLFVCDASVFLGCSDIDAHIPLERVRESAEVFRRMRASVDERIYPLMGHTINQDELEAVDALLGSRPQR